MIVPHERERGLQCRARARTPMQDLQRPSSTSVVGKLVMSPPTHRIVDNRPLSPLSKAEHDVSATVYANTPPTKPKLSRQRYSCPDFGPTLSTDSSGSTASVFLGTSGNMYSPKTCSVVSGTRASVAGSRASANRLFKRQSTNKLVDPFEADYETTNLLEWFDEFEKSGDAEYLGTWGRTAVNDDDSDVLDMLREETPETNVQESRQPSQREEELARSHQLARWEHQEAKMDVLAMMRREVEERRIMQCFREMVSDSMVEKAGSPLQAYKALDHNCSGRVSMNEFEGGVRTLGVNWEQITGFGTIRELFRLFDQPLPKDPNKEDDDLIKRPPKGYLTFADLFPLDAKHEVDPARMSTPDFWSYWCSRNKDVSPSRFRVAPWDASGAEAKLAEYKRREAYRERTEERKTWMRGMIHRLKHNGKSDARCREIVALHLPKGSGPKDLEDVHTFSKNEVHNCKKTYVDKVQESVRRTEVRVSEMHDFRTKLRTTKQQLYHTTEEPRAKAKQMEENRTSLMQLGTGLGGLFKKEHHPDEEEGHVKAKQIEKSRRRLSQVPGLGSTFMTQDQE